MTDTRIAPDAKPDPKTYQDGKQIDPVTVRFAKPKQDTVRAMKLSELKADTAAGIFPPLIILNGVTVTPEQIADIDQELFERITVLRGPAAEKLYGEKGANGAILITTGPKPDTVAMNDEKIKQRLQQELQETSQRMEALNDEKIKQRLQQELQETSQRMEAMQEKLKEAKISVLSGSKDGSPSLALSDGQLAIHSFAGKTDQPTPTTRYRNGQVTVYLSAEEERNGATLASKLLADLPRALLPRHRKQLGA